MFFFYEYGVFTCCTLFQAINNYSLTVTQNDATRKSAASTPVRSLGSDGKASLSHSSTSSEHSAARIYVFEGLLGEGYL